MLRNEDEKELEKLVNQIDKIVNSMKKKSGSEMKSPLQEGSAKTNGLMEIQDEWTLLRDYSLKNKAALSSPDRRDNIKSEILDFSLNIILPLMAVSHERHFTQHESWIGTKVAQFKQATGSTSTTEKQCQDILDILYGKNHVQVTNGDKIVNVEPKGKCLVNLLSGPEPAETFTPRRK